MRIRSTEREHAFTKTLFGALNLFSLQGLTLSKDRNWTAAIEAIQYEPNEEINLRKIFPLLEVKAKYYLACSLQIPFYYVVWQNDHFFVYEIQVKEEQFISSLLYDFNEWQYVEWWASLKGLSQPKELMEASERVKDSIFDQTLTKYKMAWGGNIDGYMFKNKQYGCIIENIYTQKHPLHSEKGEPSGYFHSRGPNYNTWLPTVKLANQLNVPLFLFTMEGFSNRQRIGFTSIDYLDTTGIYYQEDVKPNTHIIEGLDTIIHTIHNHLSDRPPYIK